MILFGIVAACVRWLNGIFRGICVGNVTEEQFIKNSAVFHGAVSEFQGGKLFGVNEACALDQSLTGRGVHEVDKSLGIRLGVFW